MRTHRPVHVLPLTSTVAPEVVLNVAREGALVACDFYVNGAEVGAEIVGGYQLGRILKSIL